MAVSGTLGDGLRDAVTPPPVDGTDTAELLLDDAVGEFASLMADDGLGELYEVWRRSPLASGGWDDQAGYGRSVTEIELTTAFRGLNWTRMADAIHRLRCLSCVGDELAAAARRGSKDIAYAYDGAAVARFVDGLAELRAAAARFSDATSHLADLIAAFREASRKAFDPIAREPRRYLHRMRGYRDWASDRSARHTWLTRAREDGSLPESTVNALNDFARDYHHSVGYFRDLASDIQRHFRERLVPRFAEDIGVIASGSDGLSPDPFATLSLSASPDTSTDTPATTPRDVDRSPGIATAPGSESGTPTIGEFVDLFEFLTGFRPREEKPGIATAPGSGHPRLPATADTDMLSGFRLIGEILGE